MSHLEDLLCQYYDWRGYIVRRNVKVGRLGHGGWEGELDIVAYHPQSHDLLHIEPSIDAHPWHEREARFKKKFAAGRKYIFSGVFPWLGKRTRLQQVAVLISRGKNRDSLAGGRVVTFDEVAKEVADRIRERGRMASDAIPEQYDLLRTIQLVISGYYHTAKSGVFHRAP